MQPRNKYLESTLFWIREYRVVTLCLISFMLFWAYQAYLFVNTNYKELSDFIVAFYISIIAGAVWCIKFWVTTHASGGSIKPPSIEEK